MVERPPYPPRMETLVKPVYKHTESPQGAEGREAAAPTKEKNRLNRLNGLNRLNICLTNKNL